MEFKFTTTEVNSPEFKSDPVEWFRKKGGTDSKGDIRKVKPHPKNVRLRSGQTYRGIKVTEGTMDRGSLRENILSAGRIRIPLVVSEQADKSLLAICGNNRAIEGTALADDPNTPQETVKNLTTETPMIVLTGLNLAQELKLMQDQDQKEFSAVDQVNSLFNRFDIGEDVFEIGYNEWRSLVPLFGSVTKKLEIEQAAPSDRRAIIKKWVNGSLYCKLYYAWQLGPIVQKAVLGAYMMQDGVKFSDEDKPYFMCLRHIHNGQKVNADGQKQMARLRTAREEDEAANRWNATMLVEGTSFKAVMDELRKESYPEIVVGESGSGTKPVSKMLPYATCQERTKAFLSNACRDAALFCMSQEVPLLKIRDEFAAAQETKKMLADQHRARLTGQIDFAEVVDAFMYQQDMPAFSKWLLSKLAPITAGSPVDPPDNTGTKVDGVSHAG